jgi:putative acetyltransferase
VEFLSPSDSVPPSDSYVMHFRLDDLHGPEIAAFLTEHLEDMHANSPPESVHALDLSGLRKPEISFWTLWDGNRLIACCALKELDPAHGELKSMRVSRRDRGRGIGAMLVEHLTAESRRRGYARLSLETGSMAFFNPAHRLYERFGFTKCGPFASYREDPNSKFMTLELNGERDDGPLTTGPRDR